MGISIEIIPLARQELTANSTSPLDRTQPQSDFAPSQHGMEKLVVTIGLDQEPEPGVLRLALQWSVEGYITVHRTEGGQSICTQYQLFVLQCISCYFHPRLVG